MEYAEPRRLADPERAVRQLLEIASGDGAGRPHLSRARYSDLLSNRASLRSRCHRQQMGKGRGGTGPGIFCSVPMSKNPTKIEVMQEGDERFLLKTFADGSEERKPIVKLPRKAPRFPYRKVNFDKTRKKGF
jgi:hypothetical protein